MGKSRLTYYEIVTFSVEAESIINSRPLSYVDYDPNNDILTPPQLVCERKLNGKCFTYNKDVTDPDVVVGYVVLIKEEKSRMLLRKGLVTKLIEGKDNLIRGAELKVCQPSLSKCTNINRPL